jgi:hypothetical protein
MTGFISSVWRWSRGTSWTASATDSRQDLLEEATRGAGRAGDERLQLLERNPGIHLSDILMSPKVSLSRMKTE